MHSQETLGHYWEVWPELENNWELLTTTQQFQSSSIIDLTNVGLPYVIAKWVSIDNSIARRVLVQFGLLGYELTSLARQQRETFNAIFIQGASDCRQRASLLTRHENVLKRPLCNSF